MAQVGQNFFGSIEKVSSKSKKHPNFATKKNTKFAKKILTTKFGKIKT